MQSWGIVTLIKIFEENNLTILNKLGKFLKTCWEKRTITSLVQDLVQRVTKICETQQSHVPAQTWINKITHTLGEAFSLAIEM